MDVRDALAARKSVRAFRPDPIPGGTLARIFAAAQRAPSWCNIQPWRAVVTSGAATDRLRAALLEAARTGMPAPDVAFPIDYPEPYGTHRKECGKVLYSAMGIARDDKAGRYDAWMRNYQLFDAPHAAIVSMARTWGIYAALDVGCWLQSLLLAAAEEGVASCAQASLATYPAAARAVLGIPDDQQILFGISLGYEVGGAAVNAARTTRAPLADNIRFLAE